MPTASLAFSKSQEPNYSNYRILQTHFQEGFLIIKIQYDDHKKESNYKGIKILVFEKVDINQALMWRKIDPHFKEQTIEKSEAPSPIARFPASEKGWKDALGYISLFGKNVR